MLFVFIKTIEKNMKITRFSIYLFSLLYLLIAEPIQVLSQIRQAPKELDFYLCIGQSNMAGRGTLTSEVMDTLQGVWLLNASGIFEPAVNPLNRYSTIRKELSLQRMGPVYSFAKEMHLLSERPIGLVVNARGGSSINSWLKGSPDGYYEEALKRVEEAQTRGGHLRAVIWHQGEADCAYPEAYLRKLVQFITDLRHDLKCPDIPVVVGEISHWNWTKRSEGTRPFNSMINQIIHFLPYTLCVSSEGLSPDINESDPHFDTESQIILGQRYAKAVWQLLQKEIEQHIQDSQPNKKSSD